MIFVKIIFEVLYKLNRLNYKFSKVEINCFQNKVSILNFKINKYELPLQIISCTSLEFKKF